MKHLNTFFLCFVLLTNLLGQSENTSDLPDGVYAKIQTNKGLIIASLNYKEVPMTVANFVGLAEGTIENKALPLGQPYYTGSKWHRVVPEHVIQGGSPANAQGRLGYSYPNEIYSGLSHEKAGVLGIANAGPHTNGSQFYITLGDRSYLDGNYNLFGRVVEGMDVVYSIVRGDVMESIKILRVGKKASRFRPDTKMVMKMITKSKERLKKKTETREKKELAYIAKNYPKAKKDTSDIFHEVLKEGAGGSLSMGKTITIKYTGRVLTEGLQFVSNLEDGSPIDHQEAGNFKYTIGKSNINRGLDAAIAQMKVGEKRLVIIPSRMAYGRSGFYGPYKPAHQRFVINPGSRLLIEVEILSVSN